MFGLYGILGSMFQNYSRPTRVGGNPWIYIGMEIAKIHSEYNIENNTKVISEKADKLYNKELQNGNDTDSIDDGSSWG